MLPRKAPRFGLYAMVLVGAIVVGSIATTWHGVIVRSRRGGCREWHYSGGEPDAPGFHFDRGEEMGHFQLGSTVVVLMPGSTWRFSPDWQVGRQVRLRHARPAGHGIEVDHPVASQSA